MGLSQKDTTNKVNFGLEIDALPYATGGYFGAVWVGKNHWRIRALTASVNKPDWSISPDFTNNHINAYAVLIDRFFNKKWSGLWLGGGVVHWNSEIQTNARKETAKFRNNLLNGSLGYNFKIKKRLYLSPWAGMSVKISGNQSTPVDNQNYTLPLFNPEASLKLGVIL